MFATAYGNVGSSIYYALGLVAAHALGLTAGASAPEVLIEEIIDAFAERYEVSVETVSAVEESGIFFPLPRPVRSGEAAE